VDGETAAIETERTPNTPLDILGTISEINLAIGMSRFPDSDFYLEIVKVFYEKIKEDCDYLSVSLAGKDMKNFSIAIHGLKSILATIGAMRLSEVAFTLEMESKKGNLDYCSRSYPSFQEQVFRLYDQLSSCFSNEAARSEKKQGDVNNLRKNLPKAISAAKNFDKNTGVEVISELLKDDFDATTNALLEKAQTAFNDFDCDAALEALEQIVKTEA